MTAREDRELDLSGLVDALDATGLVTELRVGEGDPSVDAALRIDDRWVPLQVKTMSNASPERIEHLIRQVDPQRGVAIVVADRIPRASRDALRTAGWSWLDRRGHLRLSAPPGLYVEVDFEPPAGVALDPMPISGLAGRTVAYALLTDPDRALPVRKGAARLRLSPASVSNALARLRGAGLIRTDGTPVLPELFWAVSDVWRPVRTWLQGVPPIDRFSASNADINESGWCITGTAAAIEWGAPVVARDPTFDLYVAGPVELAIAARHHGTAADPLQASASIAVPPVGLVASERKKITTSPWVLAHPVAVALDLAQDQGRGREILDAWYPPSEYRRVWSD